MTARDGATGRDRANEPDRARERGHGNEPDRANERDGAKERDSATGRDRGNERDRVEERDAVSAGRSALVTGASRGIGRGIALALVEQGWRLTVVARDPDRLAAAFSGVDPDRVDRIAVDLAAPDAADAVGAAYAGKNLTLDALILAAGVGSAAPLDGYPVGRFDKQFALNTRAPFVLVSKLLPLLRAAGGGRVIALASIAGVHAEQSLSVYGASKAALLALCRGINAEESARGVTATAIAPGYVDTDMSAWVHDTVPPETMIPVDDVVRTVTSLLSLSPQSVIDEIVMRRATAVGHRA